MAVVVCKKCKGRFDRFRATDECPNCSTGRGFSSKKHDEDDDGGRVAALYDAASDIFETIGGIVDD